MTVINKAVCFFLLCFVVTLFASCPIRDPDPSYVNIYPSDIEIPGYGTLKYTETLWDGKNQGTEIFDAVKVDNEMWIYTRDNAGFYINKGVNQSSANRISLSNDYSYWVNDQEIITKGDYVLVFAEIKENKPFMEITYLTRIYKNSSIPEYIKAFNEEDYDSWDGFPYVYYGYDDVFLVFYEDKDSSYYFSSVYIYKLNNDCDKFVKSTEEAFNNFLSQNKNIIMDDNGIYRQIKIKTENNRIYRLKHPGFEVSVDNELIWHSGNIGTNITQNIIIQNGTVYVFCSGESRWVSSWGTKSVGGGIHVFKWEE